MLISINLLVALGVATAVIGTYLWMRHPARTKKQLARDVGMNTPPRS